MPKKQLQPQPEVEMHEPIPVAPKRTFDDLVVWQPADDEPFQLGEKVVWRGSGRYVDDMKVQELRGCVGVVISATYSNMFGDVTNRVIRFELDGKPVFVRAAMGELEYAE